MAASLLAHVWFWWRFKVKVFKCWHEHIISIYNKIKDLPAVTEGELNKCVGFVDSFKSIGFYSLNKEYFLFSLADEWEFECPDDCTEITLTEFKQLNK